MLPVFLVLIEAEKYSGAALIHRCTYVIYIQRRICVNFGGLDCCLYAVERLSTNFESDMQSHMKEPS